MFRKSFLICCVAVLLTAFCLSAVNVSMAEKKAEEFDTVKALTSGTDKLAVAVSAIYRRAGDIVIALPYASINLSQTSLMKVYSGEMTDAVLYLNTHADTELKNAHAEMDDILSDFDKLLKQYSVPTGSTYRTKRAELATLFSGLKNDSTELIRRTRTLITGTNSGYDNYYTAYCEQLQKLSDKLISASEKIDAAYDEIMKSLLGNDYSMVS
ncbi:MAG: hypothetical protein IJC49_03020 [Clostridia bacterium]|nr:hypothetical protein [Clostridia bacterium]